MSLIDPAADELVDTGADLDLRTEVSLAASRDLREAMGSYYVVPEEFVDWPADTEELQALVTRHGLALAVFEVTQGQGGVSSNVIARYGQARTWMTRARNGEIDLTPLVRRTTARRQLAVIGTAAPGITDATWDRLDSLAGVLW